MNLMVTWPFWSKAVLESHDGEKLDFEAVLDVMSHSERIEDEGELPRTGMPVEIERIVSPVLIRPFTLHGQAYGTR